MMGWRLRKVVKLLAVLVKCLAPPYHPIMNILIWNCRGALKPNFQSHVRELARNHNPIILVVMETRVGEIEQNRLLIVSLLMVLF